MIYYTGVGICHLYGGGSVGEASQSCRRIKIIWYYPSEAHILEVRQAVLRCDLTEQPPCHAVFGALHSCPEGGFGTVHFQNLFRLLLYLFYVDVRHCGSVRIATLQGRQIDDQGLDGASRVESI